MRNKPYDYFRVIKITIVFMIILISLTSLINIYYCSADIKNFLFGVLFTIVIFLTVINLTYKYNMKYKGR